MIYSSKMYKSRFKRWNFAKNQKRKKSSRLPIDQTPTLERNGKPFAKSIRSPDYQHSRSQSKSVVSPSSQSSILTSITSLNTLVLQELLHIYYTDNYAPITLSPPSPHNFNYVLSDLTAAYVFFSQSEIKLGGAFCERAFRSIHILATPASKFDLFVFLLGQLVWSNKELTREAWKYLTAYSSTVPGSKVLLQRIFQGFNQYIRERSFEAYLDFLADQLTDMFLKHNISNRDFIARSFLSSGIAPFFTAQFKDMMDGELGKTEDNRLDRFTKRIALHGFTQRTLLEPQRSSQIAITQTNAPIRAWENFIELRALDLPFDAEGDDELRRGMELMERSRSCGILRPYFEGAASVLLAMYHRARWDGKGARGDARHELARLYLEKSVDATLKCKVPVACTYLVQLVVLKKWQREAECVEEARATHHKAREWVRQQSLLMGCETVRD
jgi:hypothetical protein